MTDKDAQITQDIIDLMTKHGAVGFVGTFLLKDQDGFTTFRAVHPSYDDTRFRMVESTLVYEVNKVFGSQETYRETVYMTPTHGTGEMPH